MIVSIASSKGGIGKSTVTMHLSTALGQKYKVCVIDCDVQTSIIDIRSFEQTHNYPDSKAPFHVVSMPINSLRDQLPPLTEIYDIIFLDLPRISLNDETNIINALFYCDAVFVPVTANMIDVHSTIKFISNVLEPINAKRIANDLDFMYYGFLNKRNRRKENDQIKPYLEKNGLNMLESELPEIKEFSYSDTFSSLLDSSTARERFKPLYDEITKILKLK